MRSHGENCLDSVTTFGTPVTRLITTGKTHLYPVTSGQTPEGLTGLSYVRLVSSRSENKDVSYRSRSILLVFFFTKTTEILFSFGRVLWLKKKDDVFSTCLFHLCKVSSPEKTHQFRTLLFVSFFFSDGLILQWRLKREKLYLSDSRSTQ